jgi:hypothetical protein
VKASNLIYRGLFLGFSTGLHKIGPTLSFFISFIAQSAWTPWSTVLFDNLIVIQLVKKYPSFMELEGSLPCSQEPDTGPYPEPDEPNPHPQTLFPYNPFYYYPPTYG